MQQDSAANQKHGGRAGDGKRLHQIGRHGKNGSPQTAQQGGEHSIALALAKIQACVVQLHNARDQAIYAYRHRSEEHTSELQSLMRISYAVFCLKKKKQTHKPTPTKI